MVRKLLFNVLGMVVVPGLLLPLLLTFTPRIALSDSRALAIALAGVFTAAAWLLTPMLTGDAYLFGLQPMLPGLLVTVILVPILVRPRAR